jgi:hypothetical protein
VRAAWRWRQTGLIFVAAGGFLAALAVLISIF